MRTIRVLLGISICLLIATAVTEHSTQMLMASIVMLLWGTWSLANLASGLHSGQLIKPNVCRTEAPTLFWASVLCVSLLTLGLLTLGIAIFYGEIANL